MFAASRLVLSALCGVTLLFTASACAGTPTSSPSPAATPVSSAPSPVPTPTPTSVALTCESLVGETIVTALVEQGQTMTPQTEFHQKVIDEAAFTDDPQNAPEALFVNNGGVICQWGMTLRASALYGFSPIDPPHAAIQQNRLLADGFVTSTFSGGSMLFSDPGTDERLDLFYLFTDGYWYMATLKPHLMQMVANFPND